jgi:hypothetical protein
MFVSLAGSAGCALLSTEIFNSEEFRLMGCYACGSCENRRFGACRVLRLLVTASVVPSSPILITLMMEAMSSSETSVLTRTTQQNILEDGIIRV